MGKGRYNPHSSKACITGFLPSRCVTSGRVDERYRTGVDTE
jgi:hypothetical protein